MFLYKFPKYAGSRDDETLYELTLGLEKLSSVF